MGNCQSSKNQNIKNKQNGVQTNVVNPPQLTNTKAIANVRHTNISPPTQEANVIPNIPLPDKSDTNEYNIDIYLNNRSLGVFTFSKEKLLIETFKTISSELPPNAEFSVIIDSNGKEIDVTLNKEKKLKEIFTGTPEQKVNLKYLGLDIPINIRKEYYKTEFIGAPRYEVEPTLQIVYYNKINSSLNLYIVNNNDEFKTFNNYFSSYCNGLDTVYLSGGEKIIEKKEADKVYTETIGLDLFYALDLKTGIPKKLTNLITPRFWHSMIYIPNKYVFIVGGANTKTVELFDITTDKITIDSEMNELRGETSLCYINESYLYAFCGFKYQHNYLKTVERCNLRAKKRTWELIEISGLEMSYISFFTTGFYTEVLNGENHDSILFLGGNDTNGSGKCLNERVYKFKNDRVELGENFSVNGLFPEKFFIPLDEDNSALIPHAAGDTVKVLLLKSNGKVNCLEFNEKIEEGTEKTIFIPL